MSPIALEQLTSNAPPDSAVGAAIIQAQRSRAARAVASAAIDTADCAELLDALGLRPEDGLPAAPKPRSGD